MISMVVKLSHYNEILLCIHPPANESVSLFILLSYVRTFRDIVKMMCRDCDIKVHLLGSYIQVSKALDIEIMPVINLHWIADTSIVRKVI